MVVVVVPVLRVKELKRFTWVSVGLQTRAVNRSSK